MKTALKLILIYIAFQFLGTWAALPFVMAIQFANTGTLDANLVTQQAIIPGLALTMLFTVWYLWKAGYLTGDSRLYSPLSAGCMVWTVALGAGAIFLLDGLTSALSFDWLEGTFDYMQTSWAGILLVALVGPVVEELFFRGGILRVLLGKYKPGVAIVVSGLIFGIIHMNPAQVVFASLAGMLLGWLYWRTRSLIPCMVVHVLNNSFSVWSSLAYPDANSLTEVMEQPAYLVCLAVAACLFIVAGMRLRRYKTEQTYL